MLIVVGLYWAQAVLVPFALAIQLTFVLAPLVSWVERLVGRVAAVLVVATLVFTALGAMGWGLSVQLDHLASDLRKYRGWRCRAPRARTSRRLLNEPAT